MRILWITNTIFPEAVSLISNSNISVDGTGSWVYAMATALKEIYDDAELYVAAPYTVDEVTILQGEKINFIFIPQNVLLNIDGLECQNVFRLLKNRTVPDVVHIHGTESPLGLAYINSCGSHSVVVSLQGIISSIKNYYLGGIDGSVLEKFTTIRDWLRKDTYRAQVERMNKQSELEYKILNSVDNVIGRTNWDHIHSLIINPNLHYHSCNELLRSEFYSGLWQYNTCRPHRIFISQGHYPLKGFHKLLEAMPKILSFYPDAEIHISGINVLRGEGFMDRMLRNGYANYISHIISKNNLKDKVVFLGPIDASKMKEELLSSNVFVLSSSIENSPNSLCEAQLLGVPIVSSNVGGVSSLIPNKDLGYTYRFEDVDELAYYICKVFDNSSSFDNSIMRKVSHERHDKKNVIESLMFLYKEIAYQ